MEGCKFSGGTTKASGGTTKANLIISPGILQRAWTSISELQQSGKLPFIVNDRFRSFTIVAFNDLQNQTQDLHLLPPFLAPLQPTHPDFGFLISKDNPSISLHASPLSTFLRLLRTTDLKAQSAATMGRRTTVVLLPFFFCNCSLQVVFLNKEFRYNVKN